MSDFDKVKVSSSSEIANFSFEKKNIKNLEKEIILMQSKKQLKINENEQNNRVIDPESISYIDVQATLLQQQKILNSFKSNNLTGANKFSSEALGKDSNIRNRAEQALLYIQAALPNELVEKETNIHPITMITQYFSLLTESNDFDTETTWQLLIFSKYVEILIAELKIYKSQHETDYLLDEAKKGNTKETSGNKIGNKIEEYSNNREEWKNIQQEILNTCSDIVNQQSDLTKEEIEQFKKDKQEVQDELNKKNEQANKFRKKSKLEQIITSVKIILSKKPTTTLPNKPGKGNVELSKIQRKREMLGELLSMYEEYKKYFRGVYDQKEADFIAKKEKLSEDLKKLDEREIIERSANELLQEAIKIGGNEPENIDAFMDDYEKLRRKSYQEHLSGGNQQDINIKPSDHFLMGVGEGIALFRLMIKHKVFTSKSDLAWNLTTYNGKKYVNISTRSLKYSTLKWLDFLTLGNFNLPIEEYEKSLETMNYNEKEAMMIALYRQSKYLGQRGGWIAKGALGVGNLAIFDKREGGNMAKGGISGFYKKSAVHASELEAYLKLANKHLTQNGDKINSLNKYFTEGDITKSLKQIFDDTRTTQHIVGWAEGKNSFKSSSEAISSLKNHLSGISGLPEDSKKRLLEQVKSKLSAVPKRGDNRRKHELGLAISGHMNDKANSLVRGMNKNRLPKQVKDAIMPNMRQDVANMAKQLSSLGSYYAKMLTFSSESNKVLMLAKKYGLGQLTKARIGVAVSQIASIGRSSFARIGSVKELSELTANLDIVMKLFPSLASSLLRSAPVLMLGGVLSTSNDSVINKIGVIASFVAPIFGPLYIMNDAAGSQGFKAGEFGVGAFFLTGDVITAVKYGVKATLPGQSGVQLAKEYIMKTALDPVYAAAEIPKLLLEGGQAGVKLVGDASTKTFPVETKVKGGKTKIVHKKVWGRLGGRAAVAVMLTAGAYYYLDKKGESFDIGIRNNYVKYRTGKKQFEGYTNSSEGAKAYIQTKRRYLEKNMKEDILQLETNLFLNEYSPSLEDIEKRIQDGINHEPYKPNGVDIEITKNNKILVHMNEIIPYNQYISMAKKLESHINCIIPDGERLSFENNNASFIYGKKVFETEIERIESTTQENSLSVFTKDMKNNKSEKFLEWEQKLSISLSRGSKIGSGHKEEWITSWMERYIRNHIE